VQFFTVGNLDGKTSVVYMEKKSNNSVFRVLDPDIEKVPGKTKAQHPVDPGSGLRSQASEWFCVRHVFAFPCGPYDLLFLEEKIVVLCSEGFKIMDLSNSKSLVFPTVDYSSLNLGKRIKLCKPMDMFPAGERRTLLCYDEFGLYVDSQGHPSDVVEWEGKADCVAWHSPYVLLFNSQFIEVRHTPTGRLIQIIFGNDMRCICDGRGANQSQPIHTGSSDQMFSQQTGVYGMMNTEAAQPDGRGVMTEHVFELVLTGL